MASVLIWRAYFCCLKKSAVGSPAEIGRRQPKPLRHQAQDVSCIIAIVVVTFVAAMRLVAFLLNGLTTTSST